MRTTEAARYARWSAIFALILFAGVACVYEWRSVQARKAQKDAPSAVPSTVQEQSAAFSYSKTSGNRTVFTVRASRATEFATGGRSLLEDVWITVYGQSETRFDNLHTRACEFVSGSGNINCAGEVQIDLESAEDRQKHPGTPNHPDPAAYVVHIATSHLNFNQETGVATTDQPVNFQFPQGDGKAIGLSYDSAQGELNLLQAVDLTLQRRKAGAAPAIPLPQLSLDPSEALHVTGSSMQYRREERAIHLLGPVQAHQGMRELVAAKVDIELDENMRAQKFIATGQPQLRESDPGGAKTLSGDQFTGLVSPEGWAQKFVAQGHVRGDSSNSMGDDHVQADRAEIEFTGATSEARRLTATGNVTAVSNRKDGHHSNLATSQVVMDFAPREKGGDLQIARATTPAATLVSEGPGQMSGKEVIQRMRLTGQHLDGAFAGKNELHELHGTGGVRFQRQIGDGPWQTSNSEEMVARFGAREQWTTVDQSGMVRLQQDDRMARGDRAHFDRLSDSAVLTGSVVFSDSKSQTTARTATFRQTVNELRASGDVVTNEIPNADGSAMNLGSGPMHVSSSNLVANTATGHAVYSGNARMWQGDSLIQADTIDVDRPTKLLTAIGKVHAIFPKADFAPASDPAASAPATATAAKPARPEFWRAEAPRMTYASNDGKAHLEGGAYGRSDQGSIRGDSMDLFFAPADPPSGTVSTSVTKGQPQKPAAAQNSDEGERQLVKATAYNNVVVDEEGRHGTASRADYLAAERKFILSGTQPIIYDASGNQTSGRQLTFFFGDDRIDVDSAEGVRTKTLHRVEK